MTDVATKPEGDAGSAASPAVPPRDVGQILITDLERRDMPASVGARENRFQVLVRQSVLNEIHQHGLSSPEIEICGVLVGNVHHDASGPWLYIEHAIRGNHATQRAAQVTFTAETWEEIQAKMDRDYPDRRILGWYHTHPGFGIFLSEMDVFIQENFFAEPWQVALVYDPRAAEEGLFLWKEGKPATERFLVENDADVEQATKVVTSAKEVSASPGGGGGGMVGDVAQFAERLDAIERRQKVILAFLALIGLIALAWPMVIRVFLPDLLQQKQGSPPINLPSDDPTSRPFKY